MIGRQEPERIPGRKVILVLFATVVVSTTAVVVAGLMLRGATVQKPPGAQPRRVAAVGSIQQREFDRSSLGQELKVQQTRRLESYGWIDRERGVAHVPIESAMELMLKREVRPPLRRGARTDRKRPAAASPAPQPAEPRKPSPPASDVPVPP